MPGTAQLPSDGGVVHSPLMLLLIQVVGAILIPIGILVSRFAREISDWEKRMARAHTWTRVTGWSGTRRGILIWRVLGLVISVYGIALLAFLTRIRSN